MEEKQMTNWQAAGIGLLIGIALFVIFCLLISFGTIIQDRKSFINGGVIYIVIASIVLGWPTVLFGTIGALIGKSRKNTRKTIWGGGIVGAVIGSSLWVILAVLGF